MKHQPDTGWPVQHPRWSSAIPIGLLILLIGTFFVVPAGGRPQRTTTAWAQTYRFRVPTLQMQVFVQPDASARIVYRITFENSPTADAIDIIDIGMPHAGYPIATMRAAINDIPLPTIRPSEYVTPGVEIPLGQHAIQPGQQGVFSLEWIMPDMVYQDTTNREYASLQITPTWFDSDLVIGTTTIQIAIHMLPGIQPDEVLSQREAFTDKAIFQDRTVAVWQWPDKRATQAHLVGVSFPQRGMQRVVTMNAVQLAVKWLEDNPGIALGLRVLIVIALAVAFFRFTGGTGISVFVVLAVLTFFLLSHAMTLLALPLSLLLIPVTEAIRHRRPKGSYLPAIVQVEGGGIKRGLTAPEAAVLLELPLNKVLALVIFGLLKKGVLRQLQDTPLIVDVAEDFRAKNAPSAKEREAQQRKSAQNHGIVLHQYELPFLTLIEQQPGVPIPQLDFSVPMKNLIQHVVQRIKHFDLSDTQDYYRRIIQRALNEAQTIGDIPERDQVVDRNLEWILMDPGYRTVLEPRGAPYRPIWIRSTSVGGSPPSGGGGQPSVAQPGPGGRTSFGDVAASFAGWTENTMGSLASAIAPGALNVPKAGGGVINLSGADKLTGDIFKALGEASSHGGSGGSGGGCACACAGCACACACAGGGR